MSQSQEAEVVELEPTNERSNITGVNRRTFMKGVTVGIVGASSIGVVGASDHAAPWDGYSVTESIKDTMVATSPAAYGFDYLMGTDYTDEAQKNIANYLHRRYGDMSDYSGYTGGDALHTDALEGAINMQISDEKIFTSIQNNIEASDNVALSKGKVALIEAMNNGDDVATAKTKMNNALDDYYSKIQSNIIEHYVTQLNQIWHINQQLWAHNDVRTDNDYTSTGIKSHNFGALFAGAETDSHSDNHDYLLITGQAYTNGSSWENHTKAGYADFQLLNGEVYSQVPVSFVAPSGGGGRMLAPWYENWTNPSNEYTLYDVGDFTDTGAGLKYYVADVGYTFADGATFSDEEANVNLAMDVNRYVMTMQEVYNARDRVNANLNGYADDVYTQYEAGEIDVSDVADPITYATELSTDNNKRAFRKAAAAQMGMPMAAEANVIITVHFDSGDENIYADLFTDHTPTDADGNEVSWTVGETYSPSSWSEPLFIVFEDEEGEAEMSQLEQDFTIYEAYDDSGNEIDSFDNESTNTQTSDTSQLQEDLEKIRQTQLDLIQEYQNNTDDGDPYSDDSDGGSGGDTNPLDALMQKYFGVPLIGWLSGGGLVAWLAAKTGSN